MLYVDGWGSLGPVLGGGNLCVCALEAAWDRCLLERSSGPWLVAFLLCSSEIPVGHPT